jgi:hypothetical protein
LSAKLSHLLGAFVNKQDDEMKVLLMSVLDCLSHMEEEGCFTGSGRGDNESPLATSDRCHEIDKSGRVSIRSRFKTDLFVGIDRLELFEGREFSGILRLFTVDGGYLDHLWAAGAVASNSFDPNSWSDSVLPHQIGWNEYVLLPLFKVLVLFAKESEPLQGNFEKAIHRDWISGEFKWFAFTWFTAVSIFVAWTVSADPSLSLATITVAITVAVAITVVVAVSVAGFGGLLAAGVR